MEIVFVFDSNYVPYFNKCVKSVLKYNPKAHITIVTNDFLDLPYDTVKVANMPKNLKHRHRDRITDATYLKLYLPKLLPYDKILYMDADIMCQGSLQELWEENCPFLCLTESHNYGKIQAQQLKHEKYGLSGVMLMNLKALRKEKFTETCFRSFRCPVEKWCHEETLINYFFYDKLKFVDKKFNYCHNRTYDDPIDEKDAILLHYCGKSGKQDMLERKASKWTMNFWN